MAKRLSPMEQKSAKKVLGDLRGTAQDMMKGKMKNLKKVTIASDSKEGLEKGLSVAEKILGTKKEDPELEELESEDEESTEVPEEESEEEYEEECSTPEEIDAKIKELLALKAKMK